MKWRVYWGRVINVGEAAVGTGCQKSGAHSRWVKLYFYYVAYFKLKSTLSVIYTFYKDLLQNKKSLASIATDKNQFPDFQGSVQNSDHYLSV